MARNLRNTQIVSICGRLPSICVHIEKRCLTFPRKSIPLHSKNIPKGHNEIGYSKEPYIKEGIRNTISYGKRNTENVFNGFNTNRKNAVSNLANARRDMELTAQEVVNSILLSANIGIIFEMS